MGDHYITLEYLKAWERGDRLWAHDRALGKSFLTQGKSIGNITGLYSRELEKRLANEFDGPGIGALKRFSAGQRLTDEQRYVAAKFIFVQRKRVPAARVRFDRDLVGVKADLKAEYEGAIKAGEQSDPAFAARAQEVRQTVNAVFDSQSEAEQSAIWHGVIPDETGPDVVNALLSFNWILLRTPPDSLLTCDNPVYFHEHEGLVAAQSEMTMPLSPSTALWATRERLKDGSQARATNGTVRELNRRTAHNSTRLVVSSTNAPWIGPFLQKRQWQLTRLQAPRR
jgi:hypothetical protein